MSGDTDRFAENSLYDDRVIEEIVTKTASHLGRDPVDLDPMGKVIEPEIVDGFASSDAVTAESELSFRYNDCRIRVGGTGDVRIEEATD